MQVRVAYDPYNSFPSVECKFCTLAIGVAMRFNSSLVPRVMDLGKLLQST